MSYLTSSGQSIGGTRPGDLGTFGGGGHSDLHSSMLGAGLSSELLGGGASDIHSAILHHGSAGIDLNLLGSTGTLPGDDLLRSDLGMYSNYMPPSATNPAKNAFTSSHFLYDYHPKLNDFGDGVTGTTLTSKSVSASATGLHNGFIGNMEIGQRHHHLQHPRQPELPFLENHTLFDQYHDDPFLFNNNSPYEPTHLGNVLTNNSLNSSQHRIHHPSVLRPLRPSSALNQHDLLTRHRELNNKSVASDSWALGGVDTAGYRHNRSSTDYYSPPHQQHQQHHPHHQRQNYPHQRPASAPLHNQYRTQQQHPSSYNASARNAYQSNVRQTSNRFPNAFNLNTHNNYSSGGPGGGGGPLDQSGGGQGGGIGGIPGVGGLLGVGGRIMGGVSGQSGPFNQPSGTDGATEGGEVRQQSVSSESQAYYGNETMIKELRPEFVRWFYKYEQDRKWKPFTGYDSIRIESKYREVFRGQLASYSHSAYYPVASSNDESTDFSKFCSQLDYHQQMANNNNPNANQGFLDMGQGGLSSRFSPGNMMQSKLWPGRAPETTVDAEFNHGGPGFPSQIRNHSLGTSLLGRMGNGNQINKDKILHKANSASALLGGPGPSNGMTSMNQQNPPDASKCIVVREGLYEVDLGSWTCFSTYWPGDTCLITRGTWFWDGTWDPLPEDQAEKLEEAHMSKFCGAALLNPHQSFHPPSEEAQKSATPLHRVSFQDFHVDWTSPTDIFWYSTATSHKLMRSVGQKLGFSNLGHRVCRGYYKPALIQDRPSEISHIVFVIHGIGQKMDTGRIVRNCSAFRDCVATMKEKYFPQLNNTKHRAEFFPVEWRSAARLDGDVVDAITPQNLLTLRQLLNSTAMDIMYYTSPLYRAEIQNALIDELNRIYGNFVQRNPNFVMNGGKVSVMAHSLGAVITYDIITGYLCGSVEDEISLMRQQLHHMPRRALPQQQGLMFNLEHFFCLGSPLSVFLALRWREPHDPTLRSQVLPHHLCRRLYNIFYPSDPVAYRMEPLLNRHYANIAPVTIHAYNAPNKPRYSDMPRERITIVTKTASDNTSTNATSTIPVPFADPSTSSAQKTTPPSNRPNLIPSGLTNNFKLPAPPSPSKAMPDPDKWGGWLGGNIMKLWKGSTSPAAGLLEQTGLTGNSNQQQQQQGQHGGGPPGPGQMNTTTSSNMNPNQNPPHSSHNQSRLPHLPHGADVMSHFGFGSMHSQSNDESNFLAQHSKQENYSTVVDEALFNIPNDLEYRIDYVLRESQFSGSGYIAALTSHTSYWNSPDAAYFVMTHLYDDLIEQATSYSSGER